jgi:hypothetical protein
MHSSYENHPPIARHPNWLRFLSTSRYLPTLILMAQAACWPSSARSEFPSPPLDERAIPPVDRHAPLTAKMIGLLFALTLDEKISPVHGVNNPDPASVGQVGYLPGVPRLGIPVRRDSDALGLEVIADATAPPARLGLGFDVRSSGGPGMGTDRGQRGPSAWCRSDLWSATTPLLVRIPS